ncbi:MAG: hypothetical protein QXY62_06470, partial [Candidatus Altiarchaeota archaeon]
KLNEPEGFISLGRSEDLAMFRVESIRAYKKQARKKDKIKIENSYLPKEVYGSAPLFLPVSHIKNRNLKMLKLYYIQEAVSYYDGEYWETEDGDKFLWLLKYTNTLNGKLPELAE